MTPANVHDSRLGEALIQGDEQGFFADTGPMPARLCARRSNGAASSTGSPGRSSTPLSPRDLAKAPQRLGGERALSGGARLRHDEALVWDGPRPLSRSEEHTSELQSL